MPELKSVISKYLNTVSNTSKDFFIEIKKCLQETANIVIKVIFNNTNVAENYNSLQNSKSTHTERIV